MAIANRALDPQKHPKIIPIKLDNCEIPAIDIGNGQSLEGTHCADLSTNFSYELLRLCSALWPDETLKDIDPISRSSASYFSSQLLSDDPSRRCDAIQRLANNEAAWCKMLEPIGKILLEDESSDVRVQAARCLGIMCRTLPAALVPLLYSLEDKDIPVRKASLRELLLSNVEDMSRAIASSPVVFSRIVFKSAEDLLSEDKGIDLYIQRAVELVAPMLSSEFYDEQKCTLMRWLRSDSLLANSAAFLLTNEVGAKAIPELREFLLSTESSRLQTKVSNHTGMVARALAEIGAEAIVALPALFLALHRNPDEADVIWHNITTILRLTCPNISKKIGNWRPQIETRQNCASHPDDHAGWYHEEYVSITKTITFLTSIIEKVEAKKRYADAKCIQIIRDSIKELSLVYDTYVALYEPKGWNGETLPY